MTEYIVEYPNTFSDFVCEDIIDFITDDINMFEIPKNNKQYQKIEKLLYTQLLIKIQDYRSRLINYPNTNEKNKMSDILNKKLYTKSFIVTKNGNLNNKEIVEVISDFNMNNYNRYNFLNYVIYLNIENENSGQIIFDNGTIIQPQIGKLILFPANNSYKYKYMIPINEFHYIITGQLCYNNIC